MAWPINPQPKERRNRIMPIKELTLKTGRKVMTGCNPTPPNRLRLARPFIRRVASPEECFNSNGTPMQMDGNDVYGECTDSDWANIIGPIMAAYRRNRSCL
jgi:hypothetical protein